MMIAPGGIPVPEIPLPTVKLAVDAVVTANDPETVVQLEVKNAVLTCPVLSIPPLLIVHEQAPPTLRPRKQKLMHCWKR
ncbi:MAG: hypothetical protein IPH33_16855 [Bacteroidetes bacterium]|nr:hypothetical protein [Bacteroidota bacterium]